MQSTEDRVARPPEEGLRDERNVSFSPPGRHSAPPSSGTAYQVQKVVAAAVVSENTFSGCFCLFIKSSQSLKHSQIKGFKRQKAQADLSMRLLADVRDPALPVAEA